MWNIVQFGQTSSINSSSDRFESDKTQIHLYNNVPFFVQFCTFNNFVKEPHQDVRHAEIVVFSIVWQERQQKRLGFKKT